MYGQLILGAGPAAPPWLGWRPPYPACVCCCSTPAIWTALPGKTATTASKAAGASSPPTPSALSPACTGPCPQKPVSLPLRAAPSGHGLRPARAAASAGCLEPFTLKMFYGVKQSSSMHSLSIRRFALTAEGTATPEPPHIKELLVSSASLQLLMPRRSRGTLAVSHPTSGPQGRACNPQGVQA